jgi:hypothetical protein
VDERTFDDRVTAYERHTERPADADELLLGMADKQRRGTLAGLLVCPVFIALGVLGIVLPGNKYLSALIAAG